MKSAEKLYYDDIVPTLDPYNECSELESEKDKEQFLAAFANKDVKFFNYLISLFDEEIADEKEIIDNIKYLMGEVIKY